MILPLWCMRFKYFHVKTSFSNVPFLWLGIFEFDVCKFFPDCNVLSCSPDVFIYTGRCTDENRSWREKVCASGECFISNIFSLNSVLIEEIIVCACCILEIVVSPNAWIWLENKLECILGLLKLHFPRLFLGVSFAATSALYFYATQTRQHDIGVMCTHTQRAHQFCCPFSRKCL